MTVLSHDLAGAGMIQEKVRGQLTAEIFRDLAGVESLWRGLEADPACLATPYQRFDWVTAYQCALQPGAAPQAAALRIMVLRDAARRVRALLPLVVACEHGVRVARVVGAKHANYHMPLFASREAAAMPHEDIADLLRRAGRGAGIDVYALDHQPRFWDGAANPLCRNAEPGASDAYGMILGPTPEATVLRAFSADARKKMRAKERKLVEAFGPLAYRVATAPEEISAFLEAFYRHKAARFSALGIADPYADPAVRRFIAAGACRDGGRAAIEVAALVAAESGRVFATFAGAVDAVRYSGMMTAFDQDPVVSRSSPGDLLLHHLIRDHTARGRRAFDLGVGEARYKASVCDETIELGCVTIPVTLRGGVFALQRVGAARLKRRIKRDPRLMAVVKALRRPPAGDDAR